MKTPLGRTHLARSQERVELAERRLIRAIRRLIRAIRKYSETPPKDEYNLANRRDLCRALRRAQAAIEKRKKLKLVLNQLIKEAVYYFDETPKRQLAQERLQCEIDNAYRAREDLEAAEADRYCLSSHIHSEQTWAKGTFKLPTAATWNNTKLVQGEYQFTVLAIPTDQIVASVECEGKINRFIAHARESVLKGKGMNYPRLLLHVGPESEAEVVEMVIPGPNIRLKFLCKHKDRKEFSELRQEIVPLKYARFQSLLYHMNFPE